MSRLLEDKNNLILHIKRALYERLRRKRIFPLGGIDLETAAGVLLLLGSKPGTTGSDGEPYVVFNKRSLKVRQPGDLCFPGGSIAPRIDPYLARLFSLPLASLGRWSHWACWKKNRTREAKLMSIIWATGLRESLEEMRLNPFGVTFLGPLPSQSLVMFKRTIYPMVGWIERQKRFFPNWEVEKVVPISLKDLLNSNYYGRYRLWMDSDPNGEHSSLIQDFPCFRVQADNRMEVLWGATYRITIQFLENIFDFKPPALNALPVVEGTLDETYLTGKR
jgi:hypothetical protein